MHIKGRESYKNYQICSPHSTDKNSAADHTFKTETKKKHSYMVRVIRLKILRIFIIIIILSCLVTIAINSLEQKSSSRDFCSFKDLQLTQNLSKTTIRYLDLLQSHVNDLRPDRNSNNFKVFLCVYDGTTHMKLLFHTLSQRIAECFVHSTKAVRFPIEEFKANKDYGGVINQFLNILDKGRVVKIGDLNEIPSKTAMALHFMCDTYTPPASNVIILMSLVIDTIKSTPSKGSKEKLEKLWYELKKDEIDPLINRLTEVVIPLEAIKK